MTGKIGTISSISEVVRYSCSIHGNIGNEKTCPYCDLCEHGMMRTQHCDKCSADTSWATAPITDDELAHIEKSAPSNSIGWRMPRQKRNYTSLQLLPKLLAEYRKLRAANISQG